MQLGKNLWRWGREIYIQLLEHEAAGYAAQLAYFLFLSVFPLMLTIISLLPLLPLTLEMLLHFMEHFVPETVFGVVRFILAEVNRSENEHVLSIGIIVTLWSASTGMNAIIRVMNRAYELEEKRHFLIVRFISMLLTAIMIFTFLFALLLPIFGRRLGLFIFSKFNRGDQFLHVWNSFRWLISLIILFINFSVLYFITPNKKIPCRTVFPGALFASLTSVVASVGFSFYVSNFANYTVTYGSIGVVIVFMVWLYMLSYTVIIGGEINAYIERKKNENKLCE